MYRTYVILNLNLSDLFCDMLQILVVCVLVLATQVSGMCKSDLTEVEQTVLDNINMYRQKFEDTPDLCYGASDSSHTYSSESWSRTLSETEAQHGLRNSGQAGVSETLYWICIELEPLTRNYVVGIEVWYNQVQYYQYDHPSYAEDQMGYFDHYVMCRQFLTMLGAQVREVNCGHALADGSNGSEGFYIVCQFYPGTTYQTAASHMQRPKDSNELDEYVQMLKDVTAERKAAFSDKHNMDENTDNDNMDQDTDNDNMDQDTDNDNMDQDTDNTNMDQDTDNDNMDQDTDKHNMDEDTDNDNMDEDTDNDNMDQDTDNDNMDQDTDNDDSDTRSKKSRNGDNSEEADSSNPADTVDQAGSLIDDMLADTKMIALEAFLVLSAVSVALVYKYRHTTVGAFFAGIPSAMFRCARKTGYNTLDGGKDRWFETKLKWKHREYSGL